MNEEKPSLRHRLFYGSLALHQLLAKRFKGSVRFIPDGYLGDHKVVTQRMAYDTADAHNLSAAYDNQADYVRYRTFELVAQEIAAHGVAGDIAEAGVDYGDCTWILNELVPDRTLYLYDTFRGFDARDVAYESEHEYTSEHFYESANYFLRESFQTAEDQMAYVRGRLKYPEKAVFRQGYFPETAVGEEGNTFAFASLDMDLYQPILNGILFFYPRLAPGGYIMIHDYNHREFKGIKDAVKEAEKTLGPLAKLPLPDQGGSLVIHKAGT